MWIARAVAKLDPDDMESVEVLAKLMESEQKSVRTSAARHLLQLKLKPSRIFHIMKWIKKGVARPQNSMVGMWCRWILARSGKPMLPTIAKWLADDSNLAVQVAAIDVAGQSLLDKPETDEQRDQVDAAVEDLLPEFTRLLGSKNIHLKRGAAMFLGQARSEFGDRKLDWPRLDGDTLTTIAKMPWPDMRQLAAGLAALYEVDPPARRQELLEQLRNDRLPAVRAAALLITLKVSDAGHGPFLEELIGTLDKLDADAQRFIVPDLADTRVNLELMLPKLLDLLDRGEVRGLEYSFSTVGKAAIPGLTKRLSDARPQVRNEAANALGMIGDPIAADGLIRLMDDEKSRLEALKALLQLRQLPQDLTPRLISIVKSEMDDLWSTERDVSIQLLGKIGPAASAAIPVLARQEYELTENYTGGDADVVPEKAALMAAALAKIEPKRDVGLMGFRKILTGVTTGRTWLYEQGSADKSSGYEMAIDSIVELDERCKPLVPKLVEIAEPPGQFIHPSYRGLAAYALSKLQPNKAKYWTTIGKRMYDRLGEYGAGRRSLAQRFGFEGK